VGGEGPRGKQGITGQQGITGIGEPGERGVQGIPGLTGPEGIPGVEGAMGLPGPVGLPGPKSKTLITVYASKSATSEWSFGTLWSNFPAAAGYFMPVKGYIRYMSVMGLGDSTDYQEALNTSFTVYVTIDGVLQRQGKLIMIIYRMRIKLVL
jgi:hypothetical protein